MTELTEEEPVAMAADVEETQLQQFYGQELAFDDTSSWDDKGENQLGLSTDTSVSYTHLLMWQSLMVSRIWQRLI